MATEVRAIEQHELESFVSMLETSAGRHPTPDAVVDAAARYLLPRTLAAFVDGRIVGGTGSELIELTVPGDVVAPAAKITLTGLLPGHRHRGLASTLMRRQLEDLHADGEPMAVLTTAQSGVPGRHGFGPATKAMAIELTPVGRRPPADMNSERVRLVDCGDATTALPCVFDQHRRHQVGQVSRSDAFWRAWFTDDPLLRTGPSERFVAVADDGRGGIDGYLTYRLAYGPLREEPVRELIVEDLVAATADARRSLWRFCVEFDQASQVSAWNVPIDEPLPWMLSDHRAVRVTAVRDFLQLRLVDVPAALARRRYATADRVAIDVNDEALAANNRRFLVEGGPDEARCEPTDSQADLAASAADLASIYLGGVDVTTLVRAGRVTEYTSGAARRADVMFGWRPAPWTITDW
jgi:predicted acetyltransferase